MNLKIKFNDNYPKLWGQDCAQLFYVDVTYTNDVKESGLFEYDCKKSDGSYYELKEDSKLILLYFIGNKGIPFCTLRNYDKNKHNIYLENIGHWFDVEVIKE